MKKTIPVIVAILVIIAAIAIVVSIRNSSSKGNEDSSGISGEITEREDSDVSYTDENEDEPLQIVKKEPKAFYGTWEAPSDKATGLYGNIDITIKEDGTWKGSITEEPLSGKWVEQGDHLHMINDLFSFDLAFSNTGNLVFIDREADNTVIVLKKTK